MSDRRTLFDKIWDAHVIVAREDGQCLLRVDRHFVHEGSFHAFDRVARDGHPVLRPDLTFGITDHYVPSHDRDRPIADPEVSNMVEMLKANAAKSGIRLFGLDDPAQGIVHVVGPEQGLTLPGLLIVCGDSHTATHGAFGSFAFGIGASEAAHVLATQALWQRRPRRMRIEVGGRLGAGVSAKDLILAVIAKIGAGGATGHVIEYAGEAVRALSMEGRMTLCNMSIEAGGRAGLVAPDETTFAYLAGRPYAPTGAMLDRAIESWRALAGDADAEFDAEVALDGRAIEPMVTWGTSPEEAVPISGRVPDPAGEADPDRRRHLERSLDYMGLRPGTPLDGLAIDQIFIGSCTNARIEDLRIAAAILKGRRASVPGLVVAGSTPVKRQAEAEGLDRIFIEAGLSWGESGCSLCVGMNGDLVPAGHRCASTSNRNFPGRQGKGARTHLVSPAMAAAAAVTGCLTDVRKLEGAPS